MNQDIYTRQPKQKSAISMVWDMFWDTITHSISVINRGATALDNLASVAETESQIYVERSNLHNEADIRLLKRQIAAEEQQ